MEYTKYEQEIWNKIINPKIVRMTSEDEDLLFIGTHVKEKIWLTYEKYKNSVHTYMHNPDGRIDRHKVASVMLFSIITNKPFDVKFLHGNQNLKGSTILANEILGFNSAISIVWSFIMSEAEQTSNSNKIELFKNNFVFPVCEHDTYEANVFKMLYYAKHNDCYDIFAFSHVLFYIEAYTELVRKNELLGRV
ncbi:MAG: hypothetical protein FWD14_02305 [Treponema sp.]|nr:hypothetical protein [Treponema sp.]